MCRIALIITLLIISGPTFAHAGHDHADPMASLIHLVWLAPLFIGLAALFVHLSKRLNNSNDNN